jgi:hypothetical protein
MAPSRSRKAASWKKWAIFAGSIFLGWIQIRVYFVRELLVAELLLLLAFGLVGAFCGVCLLLGVVGERGGLLIREGSQAALRACVASTREPLTPERNRAAVSSFSD